MILCYRCFQTRPDNGPCPSCGYDPAPEREKYPQALPAGTILAGQYVVGCVLGQGGFGITYLARDNTSGQRVAIKEFMPETMASRSRDLISVQRHGGRAAENFDFGLERFLKEAQTLAKFNGNPNIVGVHAYFEENRTAYFVMDYIEGQSLKSYLQKRGGHVEWNKAVELLLPVMDALIPVHREGMIHRDITPDNIYLETDGMVKLLDFGAARYQVGGKSQSLDVVLKPGYAPREQYSRRGKQGPFTDVYSLGACFYVMITGYIPPESIERSEQRDDLVVPSARRIQIPHEMEDILLKALEPMPEDRYQTMDEFRDAIVQSGLLHEKNRVQDAEPKPTLEAKHEAEAEPGPEPEMEKKTESEPESESKPELKVEPESKAESGSKPASEPESKADLREKNRRVAVFKEKIRKNRWIIPTIAAVLVLFVCIGLWTLRKGSAPLDDARMASLPADEHPVVETMQSEKEHLSYSSDISNFENNASGLDNVMLQSNPDEDSQSEIDDMQMKTQTVMPQSNSGEDGQSEIDGMQSKTEEQHPTEQNAVDGDVEKASKETAKEATDDAGKKASEKTSVPNAIPQFNLGEDGQSEINGMQPKTEEQHPPEQNAVEETKPSQKELQDKADAYEKKQEWENSAEQYRLMHTYGYLSSFELSGRLLNLGDAAEKASKGRADDDAVAAFTLYQESSRLGNMQAVNNIGMCYLDGKGVARNESTAIQYFTTAANAGNPDGMHNLGASGYMWGYGIEKNEELGIQWLTKAFEAGHVSSAYTLGISLQNNGRKELGFEWYLKGAQAGNEFCMESVGDCYRRGWGVEKNVEQAIYWLERYLKEGSPPPWNKDEVQQSLDKLYAEQNN